MHYCSGEGGVNSRIIGIYIVSPDLAVLCCPMAGWSLLS